MAFTVTATQSGSSSQHGVALLVRVYTNAAEAGGATSGNHNTAGATAQGSLTPNSTGSAVVFSVSADNVTTMPAAATSNAYDQNLGNTADLWSTAQGHYTGTVTAGTPLTYGAGSAGAGDHENWCAYEIQPSGGTITLDGSSPAGVPATGSGLQSGTAQTTASFTPPAGSVLVAQICAGGSGSGTGITITMSDTSGLSLVWTRRAISSTSDNFQPTFIFTTTVPATGSAPAMPSAWGRSWQPALAQRFGPGRPFAAPPLAQPAVTWQATASMSGAGTLTALMPRYIAGLAGTGYNSWLVDQFGSPKLMLLEQAWALPWNAGRWGGTAQSDYTAYFSNRSAQGYNAWYGIAWGNTHVDSAALSGGRTWDGIYPLIVNGTAGAIATGTETISLNSSFWSRIDAFFNTALQYGHACFLNLSMSYDVSDVGGIWQHATNTQASSFGAALAARYPQSTYPHVFWFWGDDDDGPNDSFYQAMLTGIQGAGDTRPLISDEQFTNTNCHIEFDNKTAFGGAFGVPNSTYNWVYSYDAPYFGVEDSYTEGGTFAHIPPVYGDGIYYGDTGSGTTPDRIIRNFTWWALASGARGVPSTSGPSDLGGGGLWTWQSDAVSRLTADPNGNGSWTTSDIGGITSFFTGLADWHKLIPDTGNVFITAGRGTRGTCDVPGGAFNFRNTNNYVCGSITPSGTLAVIYCKAAMSITIDQTKMGAGYTAMWVDPLSLATTSTATGSTYSSSGLGNNSAGDPDWVLVLQAPPSTAGTAALSGQGSLSVSGVTIGTTASLSGQGSLTAAPQLRGAAALSGAGTLSASPRFEATASLSGIGTLTASPTSSGGATASLSGLGTLAVSGVTIGTTAALSGIGTLTASPQLQATDTLTGAGTLTASPALTGAATLSGSGTLTAGPVLQATASLSGIGTLTASPSGAVSATLSGSGTLTAVWALRVPAALSGSGTLTATPGAAATAALTGSGTLTATPALLPVASLSGSGTLTSAPVQTLQATAVLAGAGSLSAAWRLSVTGSLSGLGTLATVIQPPFTVGTLTAMDVPGGSSGAVLTASDTRTGGPS